DLVDAVADRRLDDVTLAQGADDREDEDAGDDDDADVLQRALALLLARGADHGVDGRVQGDECVVHGSPWDARGPVRTRWSVAGVPRQERRYGSSSRDGWALGPNSGPHLPGRPPGRRTQPQADGL